MLFNRGPVRIPFIAVPCSDLLQVKFTIDRLVSYKSWSSCLLFISCFVLFVYLLPRWKYLERDVGIVVGLKLTLFEFMLETINIYATVKACKPQSSVIVKAFTCWKSPYYAHGIFYLLIHLFVCLCVCFFVSLSVFIFYFQGHMDCILEKEITVIHPYWQVIWLIIVRIFFKYVMQHKI